MLKEIGLSKASEVTIPKVSGIKEIKPETGITPKERDAFWKNDVFKDGKSDIKEDNYFNSYEKRIEHTPKEDSDLGSWEAERGESKFVPNKETPKGKAVLEKLQEKGLGGIEYKNAEPDFSGCSETTVKIEHMTENRYDYTEADGTSRQGNFTQADIKCSEKWNLEARNGKTDWTGRDVDIWRKGNDYSWHECCDTKTMNLVPKKIHDQCKHLGGVSECKERDKIDKGGEFDE